MRRWRFALAELVALALLASVVAGASSGWRLVRVDGASMSPTLIVGDLVVVDRDRHPAVGEIAFFRRSVDERSTLHRVVAMTGDALVTRGDANAADDLCVVAPAEVAGTVRVVIPFGLAAVRVRGML